MNMELNKEESLNGMFERIKLIHVTTGLDFPEAQ